MSTKPPLWWQCVFSAAIVIICCAAAAGQTPPKVLAGCPKRTKFESYKIRDARIVAPLKFLRLRGKSGDEAEKAVAALKGKPYDKTELDTVLKLVEGESGQSSSLLVSTISVDNCSAGELDVTFQVFSTQISPVLSTTFEYRQLEKADPEAAAGVPRGNRHVKVTPLIGYNQTDKLYAGGTVEGRWGEGGVFDSVSLTGHGSTSSHFVSAALAGHYDSVTGWMGHANWRLDYEHSVSPTDRAKLRRGRFALQAAGATHPFGGVVWRFGAAVEGGNQQSDFAAADLAPRTVSDTGYSSIKLFTGITAHTRRHALSASYGMEFGGTGSGFRGGWRKHVADVAHEFWWPVGDHRLIEVEQRFTAGALQTLSAVPVAERFFGGNREEQFIAGESWSFRSNPVIRSIPSNRFYRTSEGVGGDSFASYNSTTGVTIWRSPLIPTELSEEPDFKDKLTGQVTSAESLLQILYESRDENFIATRALLNGVVDNLNALSKAVTDAGSPSSECTDAIALSLNMAKHAKDDKPAAAVGSIRELLSGGTTALADVATVCRDGVAGAAVQNAANSLDAAAGQLETTFGRINRAAAARKAAADMSYVRRTLDIILKELNIASVSPVFVFDVARIGPAAGGPYSGTRYGVGGGLRFSLLNTVNFTGGYAWNPNRRVGEEPGAVFFSINTRNLFR